MPIKLPKAFPRRKSSGNALEDYSTPAEPSFRVLERPSNKSWEGPENHNRFSRGRPLSAEPYPASNGSLNPNNR